jgi:hypothetical protein
MVEIMKKTISAPDTLNRECAPPEISMTLWYRERRNFDPDVISKLVGINPDIFWRQGDPWRRDDGRVIGGQHPDSAWGIQSGPYKTIKGSPLLAEVEERVKPHIKKFAKAAQATGIHPRVACVVVLRSPQMPGLYFAPSTLSWLDEIGADFAIDILDLS